MPPLSGVGDRCEFLICLRLPQQSLKDPYAKFQKKIFSHSQKIVEHTEKQTNRQTETDRLIWLTSSTEVKILKYDWLRELNVYVFAIRSPWLLFAYFIWTKTFIEKTKLCLANIVPGGEKFWPTLCSNCFWQTSF